MTSRGSPPCDPCPGRSELQGAAVGHAEARQRRTGGGDRDLERPEPCAIPTAPVEIPRGRRLLGRSPLAGGAAKARPRWPEAPLKDGAGAGGQRPGRLEAHGKGRRRRPSRGGSTAPRLALEAGRWTPGPEPPTPLSPSA
ncbi:MAG: hypothetical protein HY717_01625 [Planctomycetes bacterium]|nr:hypothetical protein [Planctomycetota bacterium]